MASKDQKDRSKWEKKIKERLLPKLKYVSVEFRHEMIDLVGNRSLTPPTILKKIENAGIHLT